MFAQLIGPRLPHFCCGRCKYMRNDGKSCSRFPPVGAGWASVNVGDKCGEYNRGLPAPPPPSPINRYDVTVREVAEWESKWGRPNDL